MVLILLKLFAGVLVFGLIMAACALIIGLFALIIGGDEAAAGVVSLKDMAAGTQEKLTPAEAAAKINAALAPRRRAQAIRG